MFADLLDRNGKISREASKTDSDAGIAYAKVKAVYPHKTKEMLGRADPKDLANEPAVHGILGTTKILTAETAEELYQKMQHFVDSKEKSTGPVGKKGADVPMEYWPLIKVVRIFTKANALSTGAVVVDLVCSRNIYFCLILSSALQGMPICYQVAISQLFTSCEPYVVEHI